MLLPSGKYAIQHAKTLKWYRGTPPSGNWDDDELRAKVWDHWEAANIIHLPRGGAWVKLADMHYAQHVPPSQRSSWRARYGFGKRSKLHFKN